MTIESVTVCDVCGDRETVVAKLTIEKGRSPAGSGTVARHVCHDHFTEDAFRTLQQCSCRIIESRNGTPLAVGVRSGPRRFYVGPDADHTATRLFELFSEL